ncbi:MAG: hypothetical protein ACRC8K_03805 [Waterburya sp.]
MCGGGVRIGQSGSENGYNTCLTNGGWQTSFGAYSATYWECEALTSGGKRK